MKIELSTYAEIIDLSDTYTRIVCSVEKLLKNNTYTEVEKRKIRVIEAATKVLSYPVKTLESPLHYHQESENMMDVSDLWVLAKNDLVETMTSLSDLAPYIETLEKQMRYKEQPFFSSAHKPNTNIIKSLAKDICCIEKLLVKEELSIKKRSKFEHMLTRIKLGKAN